MKRKTGKPAGQGAAPAPEDDVRLEALVDVFFKGAPPSAKHTPRPPGKLRKPKPGKKEIVKGSPPSNPPAPH
jgi:hypothetical protein